MRNSFSRFVAEFSAKAGYIRAARRAGLDQKIMSLCGSCGPRTAKGRGGVASAPFATVLRAQKICVFFGHNSDGGQDASCFQSVAGDHRVDNPTCRRESGRVECTKMQHALDFRWNSFTLRELAR
jgi:hypothetical protein